MSELPSFKKYALVVRICAYSVRVYHIPPSLPKVQRIFLKRERKTVRARGIGAKDETEYPGLVRTGLSMNSHGAVVACLRSAQDQACQNSSKEEEELESPMHG